MVRLISDGGEMVIGRRTANWTWGQFEVVLPVGEDVAPRDDRMADAYVYRPDDRETGRFDLTFVRADARIDMNAQQSDLEATLDQASRRTEGSAYYTREIVGEGLGRSVPGRDYQTGDVVEVEVWSKVMDLPVTAIRALSTRDNPVGWAVQVGGQMLRDAEAMRSRVHELHTQIMTERRRAMQEAEQLRKQAATDRGQTTQIRAQATKLDTQQKEIVNWSEIIRQNVNLTAEIVKIVSGLAWTMRDAGQGIKSAGMGDMHTAQGLGEAVVNTAQQDMTALAALPVLSTVPKLEVEE